MTVRTSVLWKMNIHMPKKWPEMVVQRSYIKGHSFPYRLYVRLNWPFKGLTDISYGDCKVNFNCWPKIKLLEGVFFNNPRNGTSSFPKSAFWATSCALLQFSFDTVFLVLEDYFTYLAPYNKLTSFFSTFLHELQKIQKLKPNNFKKQCSSSSFLLT